MSLASGVNIVSEILTVFEGKSRTRTSPQKSQNPHDFRRIHRIYTTRFDCFVCVAAFHTSDWLQLQFITTARRWQSTSIALYRHHLLVVSHLHHESNCLISTTTQDMLAILTASSMILVFISMNRERFCPAVSINAASPTGHCRRHGYQRDTT